MEEVIPVDVDAEETPVDPSPDDGEDSGNEDKAPEKSAPPARTSRGRRVDSSRRLTLAQRDVLTEFLSAHVECALGHPSKIADPSERRRLTILWQELTRKLNSTEGPKKTTPQWQDTFHRLKCKLKCKLTSLKASGKDEMRLKLTPLDVKLLSIFKAAESRKEKPNNPRPEETQEATVTVDESEIIVVEEIGGIETSQMMEKIFQSDDGESEVHFIQLTDENAEAVGSMKIGLAPTQSNVEEARDPLELPPPPPQRQRRQPATAQRRRIGTPQRFGYATGSAAAAISRPLPRIAPRPSPQKSDPKVSQPPPPTSTIPMRPTPQKSLQKEARDAERRMINSLFQRLIESYEASNELKSKELELLVKEKESRELESRKAPDEDQQFFNTLVPYMKKLPDARRLKLRSDFQILLMEALQEEPNSPKRLKTKY